MHLRLKILLILTLTLLTLTLQISNATLTKISDADGSTNDDSYFSFLPSSNDTVTFWRYNTPSNITVKTFNATSGTYSSLANVSGVYTGGETAVDEPIFIKNISVLFWTASSLRIKYGNFTSNSSNVSNVSLASAPNGIPSISQYILFNDTHFILGKTASGSQSSFYVFYNKSNSNWTYNESNFSSICDNTDVRAVSFNGSLRIYYTCVNINRDIEEQEIYNKNYSWSGTKQVVNYLSNTARNRHFAPVNYSDNLIGLYSGRNTTNENYLLYTVNWTGNNYSIPTLLVNLTNQSKTIGQPIPYILNNTLYVLFFAASTTTNNLSIYEINYTLTDGWGTSVLKHETNLTADLTNGARLSQINIINNTIYLNFHANATNQVWLYSEQKNIGEIILRLSIYEELDGITKIQYANLTISNATLTVNFTNINGTKELTTTDNVPKGSVTVSITAKGGKRRYYITLLDNVTRILNAYFSSNSMFNFLHYVRKGDTFIENSTITLQRFINGSYRTNVECKTNVDGSCVIYIEPEVLHKVLTRTPTYNNNDFDYTYSSSATSVPIYIQITLTSGSGIAVPDTNTFIDKAITITWLTNTTFINTTINVTISDSQNVWNYVYFNVTRANFSDTRPFTFQNLTGSSSYSFNSTITLIGKYDATLCWNRNSSTNCMTRIFYYTGNFSGIAEYNATAYATSGGISLAVQQSLGIIGITSASGLVFPIAGITGSALIFAVGIAFLGIFQIFDFMTSLTLIMLCLIILFKAGGHQ